MPLSCPRGLDPLVQKAYHNVAVSPLCRIPDELLLMIMKYLDSADVASIRRTSRIFLRLFQDHHFRALHSIYRYPWPTPRFLNFVEKKDLRERLLNDRFCETCYGIMMNVREHPAKQSLCRAPLSCSVCRGPLSAGLFSQVERAVPGPKKRVCIAHEGHLRVCQHRVITWSDIQRWSSLLTLETSFYKVLVCGAQSHLSQCSLRPGGHAGSGGVMVKLVLLASGAIKLMVEWTAHVSVPHRKGSPDVYDAHDVREIAEGLHADAGQHIVPRFQADQPPHMRAFDPNYCGCVQYPGRGMLDWQMAPEPKIRDCCRKSRSRRLFMPSKILWTQLGVLWGQSEGHTAKYDVGLRGRPRYYHIAFKRCCAEPGGTGALVTHRHAFVLSCGPKQWPPDPSETNFVPKEWYGIMDPGSYGLEGDATSRNFLWCEDEKCANHVSRAYGVDRFSGIASFRPSLWWRESLP